MAYQVRLPKYTDLTDEQKSALDDEEPISLSGGAGSGKSVIALWRHIENIQNNKSSIIMTYTKTLQVYLYKAAKSENEEAAKRVHSVCGWLVPKNTYWADEIIVDEAQDLKLSSIEKIKSYCNSICYGYDFNQEIYIDKNNQEQKNIMKKYFENNNSHSFEENFRNSYEILKFVRNALPNIQINQNTLIKLKQEAQEKNEELKLPLIYEASNFNEKIDTIVEIINKLHGEFHNIAVLIPFGAKKSWRNYYDTVDEYYEAIKEKIEFECSKYHNKMNVEYVNIENLHITTIKSSKGLEFETVIIPEFDKMLRYSNQDSMKRYVSENDIYVALTRPIRNLYLFVENLSNINFIDKNTYEFVDLNKQNNSSEFNIDDSIPF